MTPLLKTDYYTNPVVDDDFPDPSLIAVPGKGYFAYATHDEFSPTLNNILVRHSWDLITWSPAVGALQYAPIWATRCEKFWCPHTIMVSNEFRLYYAAEPDTKDGMCLAMATSASPVDFRDIGKPLARVAGSTYQMIDPCCFLDPVSSRLLLYYGSAHEPIRVVELATDGFSILGEPIAVLHPGNVPFERLREGVFVSYKPAWKRYYLWVSGDNTWAENGYAVSVFWSENPCGPFTKIPHDHIVLKPNTHWDAPGQNCLIQDAAGNEWIVYHAVDSSDRYIEGTKIFKRKMCLDRVHYTIDGWPYIETNSPSYNRQPAPDCTGIL